MLIASVFFLGDIQERAVIADAGFNIKAGAFNAIKITGNQGKFAACHTLCLSKEKNKAGFAGSDPAKPGLAFTFCGDELPEPLCPARR